MARTADDLLQELLQLSTEDRARIASSLLQSLDDVRDADASHLWEAEISRRLDEIDAGEVRMVPWSEVRSRLTNE